MDIQNELHQAFKGLFDKHKKVTVFPAEVIDVDEAESTCTVNEGDIELYDVRLKSLIDNSSQSVIAIPKVGSSVLVANIGNSENAFVVIVASEIEKIKGKIGTTEFLADASGYSVKRGSEDIKTVLNDLINELLTAQVITPGGNGPFLPTVITNLTAIQVRLNLIFQ